MTPSQEAKFDTVCDSIIRLETTLISKGGLLDQVIDHSIRIKASEEIIISRGDSIIQIADHEIRMRICEAKQNISKGKVLAITTIATSSGILGAVLSNLFNSTTK